MHIRQRPIKLPTRLHHTLLNLLQLLNRIQYLIHRQLFKYHIIVCQCACLVTQEILDTTELLWYRAIA